MNETPEQASESFYDKTYKSRDIEDGHFFDSINEAFMAGANYERSKLPQIIKEVLKRAADGAKLRTYTVGSMLDEHFEVDKQSILSVFDNCDDLIK